MAVVMEYKELMGCNSLDALEHFANEEKLQWEQTLSAFKAASVQHECLVKEIASRREDLLNLVDVGKCDLAKSIIYTEHLDKVSPSTIEQFLVEPKEDLLNNFEKLRKKYFAYKNYAGFTNQPGWYTYGMGPTHGTTTLKIGLREEYRTKNLSSEEREALWYFFGVLSRPHCI